MISIINFEKDLCIPKKEAIDLGLSYKEGKRLGIALGEKHTKELPSYAGYIDEFIEKDGKYYKSEEKLTKEESESNYCVYRRCADSNIVFVEESGHLVDLETFAVKCKHKFFITKSTKQTSASIDSIQALLGQIEQKTEAINTTLEAFESSTFNQKVNVHVGGGLIVTYNDIMLMEDSCTDDLQSKLNDGWRVISVCVQADQRRPDYVLGRFKPDLHVRNKDEADRG